MKSNIYLIGFMGCGKSTISKYIHDNYEKKIVEMDEDIEKNSGMKISDIFKEQGEEYFRNLETLEVKKISELSDCIVSCGGGVVVKKENVDVMKNSGKIIFLTAKPETILERVKDNNDRPLLNGNMNVEYIENLMSKRKDLYMDAADFLISTDNKDVSTIANEIIAVMEA